jgi:hypothetical protein
MKIGPIKDWPAYETLASRYGSVFNSLDWLSIHGEAVRIYGIFDNGHSLIGAFHVFVYHKLLFKFMINPPATPHMGLFYINPASNNSSSNSFHKELHTFLADFLLAEKSALVDINLPPEIIDTQAFIWKGFQIRPKYTYLIDLQKSTDEIWEQFSSQRRKSIRKALADKMEVKCCTDNNEIKMLTEKTFDRQEKKLPAGLLDKILFAFAKPENSFGYLCSQDKKASAGNFCIHDATTAYYILGGYDASNKHHGAGALAMWESIQHAKKLGLKTFNFNGSMLPKIEEYFREFGAELKPYYNIQKFKGLLNQIKS